MVAYEIIYTKIWYHIGQYEIIWFRDLPCLPRLSSQTVCMVQWTYVLITEIKSSSVAVCVLCFTNLNLSSRRTIYSAALGAGQTDSDRDYCTGVPWYTLILKWTGSRHCNSVDFFKSEASDFGKSCTDASVFHYLSEVASWMTTHTPGKSTQTLRIPPGLTTLSMLSNTRLTQLGLLKNNQKKVIA